MNPNRILPMVLLLLCCSVLRADDSAMGGEGGNIAPLKPGHTQVRMVDEVVRITDVASGSVDATFTFQNEGRSVDQLIGFPNYYGGDSGGLFDSFRCWVDGHEVAVKPQYTAPAKSDILTADHVTWWTKRVHFAAGQTRIVHDIYSGGGGGDSSGNRWLSYVLDSGANWKGTIGRIRIYINMAAFDRYSPVRVTTERFSPTDPKDPGGPVQSRVVPYPGLKRIGSQLVIDRRDVKPTDEDDLTIQWYPAFLDILVDGKRDPLYGVDQATYYLLGDVWHDICACVPLRRGDDIWLPAKLAAHMIGGDFHVIEAGKRCRIIRGRRSVDITTGAATIVASDGSRVTMTYPATYAAENQVPGMESNHPYTMVTLAGIVSAFRGKSTLDKTTNAFSATLPPIPPYISH